MTGHKLSDLKPSRRTTWLAMPGLLEVIIVVMLTLNLKAMYDAHRSMQRDLVLTSQIAAIVSDRNKREVADCYENVPRGLEALQLIRYASAFSDNQQAVAAFRDYLYRTEAAAPTWAECAALAAKLGVR